MESPPTPLYACIIPSLFLTSTHYLQHKKKRAGGIFEPCFWTCFSKVRYKSETLDLRESITKKVLFLGKVSFQFFDCFSKLFEFSQKLSEFETSTSMGRTSFVKLLCISGYAQVSVQAFSSRGKVNFRFS